MNARANYARFGPTNRSPADEDLPVVSVPVGRTCDYFRCGEAIAENERGYLFPLLNGGTYVVHHDCYLFSLGVIEIDGSNRTTLHEPNSPECMCDAWKHGVRLL